LAVFADSAYVAWFGDPREYVRAVLGAGSLIERRDGNLLR
jgi:hypothetical protein